MAYNRHSLIGLGFIMNFLLWAVVYGCSVLGIPATALNKDKKQPELLHYDGTVFVPGFGRFMHPKKSLHCDNPFKFNPITGTCGGSGLIVPGGGDTNVPNPGVEVPLPGNGAHVPPPSPL